MNAKPINHEKISQTREFSIDEKTAEVTIIEVIKLKYVFSGREFISFLREHEQLKKQQEQQIDPGFIEKVKEGIAELEAQVDELKPIMDKVDVLQKKLYTERQNKGKIEFLTDYLTKKKPLLKNQKIQLVEIYDGLPKEWKTNLSDAQRLKILRLRSQLKMRK